MNKYDKYDDDGIIDLAGAIVQTAIDDLDPDIGNGSFNYYGFYKRRQMGFEALRFVKSNWFKVLTLGLVDREKIFKTVDQNIYERRTKRNGTIKLK